MTSSAPIPNPRESIASSTLSTFRSLSDQNGQPWLPDIRIASHVEEEELDPIYELQPGDFQSCPPNAESEADASRQAALIAQWTFDTYSRLVQKRIEAYNGLRKKVNGLESEKFLGQYRRAARLANEQILRRDLPFIPGLTWNYSQPLLPVFELSIKLDIGSADESLETVLKMTLSGTVEVRQSLSSSDSTKVLLTTNFQGDPTWSSSSSSSSSSSLSGT